MHAGSLPRAPAMATPEKALQDLLVAHFTVGADTSCAERRPSAWAIE